VVSTLSLSKLFGVMVVVAMPAAMVAARRISSLSPWRLRHLVMEVGWMGNSYSKKRQPQKNCQ
jgi:hypothetical protein